MSGDQGAARPTAVLGDFADLERDLVVQILVEHGIDAYAARPPGDANHSPYPGMPMLSNADKVMVDAERLSDARRILAEELPKHLASIEETMRAREEGADDGGA